MELDDIAKLVKSELEKIWLKPDNERPELLRALRSNIKSYGIPFFNQLLDGLYQFSTLHAKRAMITSDLESSVEQRSREKLINEANEVKYVLNEAKMKLNALNISDELKSFFDIFSSGCGYYANMQVLWQQAMIYMRDGDYDKAEEEAEKGLLAASQRKDSRNLNQFAGLKSECEAYMAFVNKRWWDISNNDYRNAISLFEKAINCYGKAQVSSGMVPEAMICLLKFISSPTLDSISYLVRFGEIRDRYPSVGDAFGPSKGLTSERKKQRNMMMRYLRNVTYKIAAFNIFEELRTLTVELENFAWKNDDVYQKLPADRAQVYKRSRPPPIETFVDDCEELLLGKDLPKSITLLRDIYHDCKHKTIFIDYNPEPDKLAEEIVNKILSAYEYIKDLYNDAKRLKGYFTKQSN